jgi:hypothetical protein
MTFTAESAATIRDRALENWRARYLARGEDLDVAPGSDAYNELDALALEFEGLALGAQEAAHRVLLRYASGQDLDDFAENDGTARKPASASRREIAVAGPPSTTTPVAGASLATAGGFRFKPIDPATGALLTSIETDGSGAATILCECVSTGVATNIVSGTVLTWNSAPTGFAATGTVASGTGAREGEDVEGDDALRLRLLERRKERPASGNRADWRAKVLEVAGVGDAFVHPCTRPPQPPPAAYLDQQIRADRPGCMVVIPVNPPPAADSYVQNADGTLGAGLDPGYSRRPSAELCTAVARFIDGTHDAQGNARPPLTDWQWYPATIFRESWGIVRPERVLFDVTIQVRVANDSLFAFTGTRTITSVTDSTHITLSSGAGLDFGAKLALLYPLDGGGKRTVIRGGWALCQVASRTGNDITLAAPLPSTVGLVGAAVRSDPGVWDAVRRVELMHFDTFGPGDVATPGRSSRFPPTSWGSPDTVVPSRLLSIALGITDVVDVAVTDPSARQVIQLGYVPVLNTLTLERLA